MRFLLVGLLWVLNVALPVVDAADIPRGTFTGDQIEEAKAVALEKKLPIFYLHTNLNSTCPITLGGTEKLVKAMRRSSVIVFLGGRSESEKEEWSALVYGAFCGDPVPALGNTFPNGVLTDPGTTKILAGISNDDLKEGSKLREFKSDARKWSELPPEKGLACTPKYKIKGQGRGYVGNAVAYDKKSDLVTLEKPGGGRFNLKASLLSPGAIRSIEKTCGDDASAKDDAKEDKESGPSFQVWTSAKGNKQLKAKFVKLVGRQITLENEDGKELSFGLDKLCKESQELAKKLSE